MSEIKCKLCGEPVGQYGREWSRPDEPLLLHWICNVMLEWWCEAHPARVPPNDSLPSTDIFKALTLAWHRKEVFCVVCGNVVHNAYKDNGDVDQVDQVSNIGDAHRDCAEKAYWWRERTGKKHTLPSFEALEQEWRQAHKGART